jgi:hypothetical protein
MAAEPVPGGAEAAERGLALVAQAYAERRPAPRPALPRLALALAIAALLAALLLSPAGAAVRDLIDDVFTAGVRHAEPALTELPGGGRLLVQSPRGSWVVQPDGSRRLLGSYRDATWSPHGLFVSATAGRTLNAIEPDGTPHWSLSAGAKVVDPRWSPSGFRIAYRSGSDLRIVHADGSDDRLVDRGVAGSPVAWFPSGAHLLAYLDRRDRIRLAAPDGGLRTGSAGAPPGALELTWSPSGTRLLVRARHALWQYPLSSYKLAGKVDLDPPRRVYVPPGATIRAAAFAPRGHTIAMLLELPGRTAGKLRSEVLLIDPEGGPPRSLFAVSGRLAGLDWSPDGSRVLTSWPAADQWLFLPIRPQERIKAVDGISAAFAPGSSSQAAFPRVEGWCCPEPGA